MFTVDMPPNCKMPLIYCEKSLQMASNATNLLESLRTWRSNIRPLSLSPGIILV